MKGISRTDRPRQPGFTIVELLVVIVVIAILATISIVSYNGIQRSAAETVLKSDLRNAATELGLEHAETGNYPGNDGQTTDGGSLKKSPGTTFQYTRSNSGQDYCLTATSSRDGVPVFHVSSTSGVAEGTCAGNTGPVSGGGGGTERTYRIAKLADNNCWMLDNLKLGSTSGSITLTPSDSNVSSNFTLPQVTTSGATEYDTPRAYGPVPGDTGSGATNYGYLYNWSAATAGETRTSITSGNAPHSICAAGWRLPTGGSSSGDFGQLDQAFGGTGTSALNGEPNIAQWQPSGAFSGTYSGYWDGGFYGQGGWGGLWAASANPGWSGYAFFAGFVPTRVGPGDDYVYHGRGFGVRCLLN